MSIEATNGVTNPAAAETDRTAERAEIKRLAQEFEAMLLTQMLREMRRAMIDEDDQEQGLGADAMTDTTDVELSRALSAGGGVGLAASLLGAFEQQIQSVGGTAAGGARDTAAGIAKRAAAAAAALPVTAPAPLVTPAGVSRSEVIRPADVTAAAPVSSGFGWRRDPITGSASFHKGIDIAVAYGREVKAAADGRVAFAGVQNGYGQTVVIDHEDGRQTRYAHLSEPLVKAGDAVTEGQLVGRSGNSGRSTGPHLHFELLVDGRPVDPAGWSAQ